jgi:hypothetical protein
MTSENHPAAESKAILSEKTDTELVKGARNKDTHKELSKPQLQAQKMSKQSYITIHEDIKEELRKGNYYINGQYIYQKRQNTYLHQLTFCSNISLWVFR